MYTKDHKWLLASHLQKSIRRGLIEEASWAAKHLHDVDRAYLAYRLSVIAVEDVGAGDPRVCEQWLTETNWGAKVFSASKTLEDCQKWQQVAESFAAATKDRTPCDWIACQYWIKDFENEEGPWEQLDIPYCIDEAYNQTNPWWKRGLMAWRVAGTKRFPSHTLPEIEGAWETWVEHSDVDSKTLMIGFGQRQREPHPVFVPLSIYERNNTQSSIVKFSYPLVKSGEWLAAALDNHTAEGKRALYHFVRQHDRKLVDEFIQKTGSLDEAVSMIGRMMFWMEGGRVNECWQYPIMDQISTDTKKRWLAEHGVSGRWLFDHWGQPEQWNKSRDVITGQSLSNVLKR